MTDGYDGPLAEDPELRPAWKRRAGSAAPTAQPASPAAPGRPAPPATDRPRANGAPPAAAPPPAAPPAAPAPPSAAAPQAAPPPAAEAAAGAPARDPEADELERGRTLALVAALGRLQMSLDLLSRQQRQHAEQVEERLARIERRLSGQ